MTIRKAVVKLLTLQCTVVKGSLLSIFMAFLALALSPAFLLMFLSDWVERRAEKPGLARQAHRLLNTPIRFPGLGVLEEANDKCNMNVKRLERFLGVAK